MTGAAGNGHWMRWWHLTSPLALMPLACRCGLHPCMMHRTHLNSGCRTAGMTRMHDKGSQSTMHCSVCEANYDLSTGACALVCMLCREEARQPCDCDIC